MCQCRIWSFCVKGRRHKYRRNPKIGYRRNSTLLGWEAWLTPWHTPTLPHVLRLQIWYSATKGVRINTREPKKIGKHWGPAHGVGRGWPPKAKHPPHMCYHVKFGSSVSKGVCINRREHPKLGSAETPPHWGKGVADLLEIRSPTCVILHGKFGRSRSKGTSGDLPENLTPRVPPFKVTQGHSSEPIQINPPSMTFY